MNKRLLSMFLVLCMVLTLLPVSAMAEEATSGASGEIIAFASLEETEKTVSLGTSFEDLELPEKLTATVRTAMSPEDELVKDSGSGDEDRSEDDSDAVTTGSTIEGVITEPSDIVETAGSEWVEISKDIPVTWASQPKYDMDTEGEYIFTPVIEGYTVTAKLPQVTVTVEAAAPMMRTLLGSSGTTLIEGVRNSSELESYINSATGNLELKLLNDEGASFAWYNSMIVIPNYVNYDITIDLKGMELSITKSGIDNVIWQRGNGKLTIKDSKGHDGKDTGKITRTGGSGPAILSEGTGGVVFEGGYIYTTSNSSAIVSNNGPVTMKGGKISNYGNVAIQCDNSTVTIEDGEINSSGNGKTSISGNIINISGGRVLSGFGNTLVGNTISVSGGTIEAGYPSPGYYAIKGNDGATITLTGGTIKNYTWNNLGVAINAGTGGTIRIPGGKVTVIGDDKAMLQAPDLSGYSNVIISGNTLSADAESLAEISIEELNAGINQYKYLLFEPGSGLPRETTPNATFTATGPDTGTLSGVTSGMKYKIDNGAWNNIYSSTNINLTGLSACTITVVKQGNGSTTSDSKPQTITVTKAAKPNLTPTQPSTIGGSGSIPMTSAHEYSTKGLSNWTSATGSTLLTPGTYLVRVKANGTVLASEPQEITLIAYTGIKETMPEATFTATGPDSGTLNNVTATMKYSVDGGDIWKDITGTTMNITGVTTAKGVKVYKLGNGITTIDSDVQTITVTKAEKPNLTPTQPSTIGGKGSIPMTSAHEYSANGGSNWISATGTTTLDPGTYLVRVKANGTVLASENQSITIKEIYTVKFVDYDGKELKTETVEHGSSATAPDDPTREGYTFTGWDKAFNNITGDLTVTAQYEINRYTVKFVDYDGKELKTETVEHGSSATAPDDPTREGYTFTGWDKAFDNVTGDLTVTAQYTINRYTVKFVDYDETELKTEIVEHGSGATAPENPIRAGYTFTGWDKAFDNVTEDLTVTAMYRKNSASSGGGGSSGTLLPQSSTVIGSVVNGNTGSHVSNIEAEITTNNNGSSTITMNASQAVVLKEPDGSSSKLSDISKITIVADTGSQVPISTDGTIKVENLKKGTENSFEISYDLGTGHKITIGKMNIKTDEKGNANFTITLVDPYGIITDSATGKAVKGVKLTLYYADTERNSASGKTPGDEVSLPLIEGFKPNNNANPQVSDEAGAYGFMVFPNADYYIVAEKEGYNKYISPTISVKKELVKWDFKMHQTGAERLYGQSRVDTSIEIAKTMYASNIPNVVLATAENYPDALTGSVLANKLNAPIFMVGSTEEGQRSILSYMKEYMSPEGTVYILGGTEVISRDFEAKIIEAGFRNIDRIDGKDRYETSVEIAENIGVKSGTPIVLVSGENYPDALSASSLAAIKQYPILLAGRNGIPDSVKMEILKINPSKIYIIGLQGAVDTEVEAEAAKITNLDKSNIVRIGGINRYETSLETAKYFNLSEGTICVATGNNFPDALAGSLYAARNNAPIILVDKALSDDQITYLKNMGLSNAVIFGGEAAVGRYIMEELSQLLKR